MGTGHKLLPNILFTNEAGRLFLGVMGGKMQDFLDEVIRVQGKQVGERVRFLVAIL